MHFSITWFLFIKQKLFACKFNYSVFFIFPQCLLNKKQVFFKLVYNSQDLPCFSFRIIFRTFFTSSLKDCSFDFSSVRSDVISPRYFHKKTFKLFWNIINLNTSRRHK